MDASTVGGFDDYSSVAHTILGGLIVLAVIYLGIKLWREFTSEGFMPGTTMNAQERSDPGHERMTNKGLSEPTDSNISSGASSAVAPSAQSTSLPQQVYANISGANISGALGKTNAEILSDPGLDCNNAAEPGRDAYDWVEYSQDAAHDGTENMAPARGGFRVQKVRAEGMAIRPTTEDELSQILMGK